MRLAGSGWVCPYPALDLGTLNCKMGRTVAGKDQLEALFSSDILQVHYFLSSTYLWPAAQTKAGLHVGSF